MTGTSTALFSAAPSTVPDAAETELSPSVRLVLKLLAFYKRFVSPLLPPACRFHPTCSEFAGEAVRRYGLVRGGGLAARRLFRCHPFHPGGFDPVP
jgi:putative membrane protein insertion efficiency factor